MRSLHYRRRFSRKDYFREWMAGRALRRRTPDFSREKPMVSIIGDEVSDLIRAEQVYERDVLEFLRDRIFNTADASTSVAIDVGANIGNHSLFLADLFARVIAFEPNPLARSLLEINIELNGIENVEVRPVGLSDQNGTATLEFDPRNLGAASSTELRGTAAIARRTTIDLVIGDEAIESSEAVAFIKVDVEGAEEAVLKGLERTMRTHAPIVMIEQWPEVIDEQTGSSPSFALLQRLGYKAWEIKRRPLFRGRLGKIPTLLLGHSDFFLCRVTHLDQREYRALIFTPERYTFSH
jgi:FkbM family methyltransferase